MQSPGITRRDVAVGAAFAAVYFTLLAVTLDIGFPRDESFYFSAGEQYSRWFDQLADDPASAFTREAVDRHFAYNPEHPALPKILFGLSWRLFGKMHDPQEEPWSRGWYDGGKPPETMLGWFSESTAMRLPALFINSLLVLILYLFAAEFFNRRVAVAAVLAWMFLPHAFWHSHLACFDMPIVTMWFLTAWCFLKAEKGGWRWAIFTGIAWGLALSTKHNAYFLPPVLLLWFFLTRLRQIGLNRDGPLGLKLPAIPVSFFAMLLISPVVYFLLWPKLWFDPVEHLKFYFNRHASHEYYWAYYFGTLYTKPPFPIEFPFVMSAMTLPAPTVLLFCVGLLRVAGEWLCRWGGRVSASLARAASRLPERQPGAVLFVFLNFLIPFAVIAHPQVPIFGGTKHWMHGVPFLAILAGLGFEWVYNAINDLGQWFPKLGTRVARFAVTAVAGAAFVVPAAIDTLHGHTNGSTYYNAAFGGFGAMGEHRMQREFWGNSAFSALAWANDTLPPGSRIDFHDTTWDAVRFYWRDGLLRRDLSPTWDCRNADAFLFHWHKEFLDLESDCRDAWGVQIPAFVATQDGVPLLNAYRRPEKPGPGQRSLPDRPLDGPSPTHDGMQPTEDSP